MERRCYQATGRWPWLRRRERERARSRRPGRSLVTFRSRATDSPTLVESEREPGEYTYIARRAARRSSRSFSLSRAHTPRAAPPVLCRRAQFSRWSQRRRQPTPLCRRRHRRRLPPLKFRKRCASRFLSPVYLPGVLAPSPASFFHSTGLFLYYPILSPSAGCRHRQPRSLPPAHLPVLPLTSFLLFRIPRASVCASMRRCGDAALSLFSSLSRSGARLLAPKGVS